MLLSNFKKLDNGRWLLVNTDIPLCSITYSEKISIKNIEEFLALNTEFIVSHLHYEGPTDGQIRLPGRVDVYLCDYNDEATVAHIEYLIPNYGYLMLYQVQLLADLLKCTYNYIDIPRKEPFFGWRNVEDTL